MVEFEMRSSDGFETRNSEVGGADLIPEPDDDDETSYIIELEPLSDGLIPR